MKASLVKTTFFDGLVLGYLLVVVLIAILHPSDEQMLELSKNTLIFLSCCLVGAGASFLLNFFKLKTLGELIFEDAEAKANLVSESWYKTVWAWELIVFLVTTLIVGVKITQFSVFELMDQQGFQGAIRLFQGLMSPNFDLLPRAVLNIIVTIFMAFMATALAIPIAFVLCFFCAKNIMKTPGAFVIYMGLRTLLNIMRSIEALIWAIIFSVWVGIGPFAGMMALMIHSIASLAKQYSEIVESVNEGPIEGIVSTGANKLQTIWFAIVPQVVLPFISFTVYRWDINIRMATIVGLVGGGGIGTLLIQFQGQAMWPEVGTIILVIAFVVWFMDTASAYLREALK